MLFEYLTTNDLTDREAVLHFRWATHGAVNTTNCHPFPIQPKPSALPSLSTTLGMAHNGIIPGMVTKHKYSDTLQFITRSMVHMADFVGQDWFNDFLAISTESKFAFMSPDKVTLVGKFVEDGGAWYSNTTFQPTVWEEWLAGLDEEARDLPADEWEGMCYECGRMDESVLGGMCAACERMCYGGQVGAR